DARREAFAERLSDLAAQVEWGVKIYVEAPAATESPAEPSADPDLSPGRAYLSHRRAQRHAREDAYRDAEQAARRVEDAARDVAVDRVQHRTQQGELAREPGENIVNDAYLGPLAHGPTSCRPPKGFQGYASRSPDPGRPTPSPRPPKPNH
ncbi:GvpL/GvpF family gas vesicle protein, partial [Streptomyces sp. NPDC005969]